MKKIWLQIVLQSLIAFGRLHNKFFHSIMQSGVNPERSSDIASYEIIIAAGQSKELRDGWI
jgi:hypothetical protein